MDAEELGTKFAELFTAEPPEPQVIVQQAPIGAFYDDDYYDEYGPELNTSPVQYSKQASRAGQNPLQNEKLKRVSPKGRGGGMAGAQNRTPVRAGTRPGALNARNSVGSSDEKGAQRS